MFKGPAPLKSAPKPPPTVSMPRGPSRRRPDAPERAPLWELLIAALPLVAMLAFTAYLFTLLAMPG